MVTEWFNDLSDFIPLLYRPISFNPYGNSL